nr:MAG TPA: hypothetical protein [Caudoviricetes sp.]
MPQVKIKEIIYTPTDGTEEPTGGDYEHLMQRWQDAAGKDKRNYLYAN